MRLGHSSSWALTVRAESHCTAPPPRTALLFLSTYLPHAELAQSTNYRSCRSRAAIMKPLTTLPLSQAQDSPHSYPLCILYTSLWGLCKHVKKRRKGGWETKRKEGKEWERRRVQLSVSLWVLKYKIFSSLIFQFSLMKKVVIMKIFWKNSKN